MKDNFATDSYAVVRARSYIINEKKICNTINSLCDLIIENTKGAGQSDLCGIAEITKALAELVKARACV